jgi:general stress protein YciG
MQPRIYTYKITFEEVPYYYYGSKKEKYFNEEYWGSPYTHKWCWELYTPKKQILELFDYTDEGYKKCREIEDRLIKPVMSNPWCLNENCGGNISLEVRRKTGIKNKKLGKGIHAQTIEEQRELGRKVKELKLGIHSQTIEQLRELGRKSGKLTYELGVGIHGLTPEQIKENAIMGGEKAKELGVGIHSLTKEQLREIGKKAGKIGGKIGGPKTYELGIGLHGLTPEQRTENGKKGAEKAKELGVGIVALTSEQLSEIGKKGGKTTGSQRWKCLETGFITTASNLKRYQKSRGIDTSQRIRLE